MFGCVTLFPVPRETRTLPARWWRHKGQGRTANVPGGYVEPFDWLLKIRPPVPGPPPARPRRPVRVKTSQVVAGFVR